MKTETRRQTVQTTPACWQREAPSPCLRVETSRGDSHVFPYQHLITASLAHAGETEALRLSFSSHDVELQVRAASLGMRVSEANSHPFQYGRFLWMHNGAARDFSRIKRRLRASLPDHLYNNIAGTTDSEHAFAVFLHLLGDTDRISSAREMGQALVETIGQLERWTAETGFSGPSYYNFAVTDNQSVAAVRYVSDPTTEPASLYCSTGGKYECSEGVCKLCECPASERTVIIASEQLTSDPKDWVRVAPNHVLTVAPDLTVNVESVGVTRIGSRVNGQSPITSKRASIPVN